MVEAHPGAVTAGVANGQLPFELAVTNNTAAEVLAVFEQVLGAEGYGRSGCTARATGLASLLASPGAELAAVQPVRHVIDRMAGRWGAMAADMSGQGRAARWHAENEPPALHEAQRLQLDCAKAAERLGWTPKLSLDQALDLTTEWYWRAAAGDAGAALLELTRAQISGNS